MTLRVIAGEAKGARLDPGKDLDLRPTGSKVREALFSRLADLVPGAAVLDLFAGTGSLGIEALSRGARRAVFVESSRRAAALIERNLKAARLAERGEVVVGTAESFISSTDIRFDLVLMDPPWAVGVPAEVLGAISEHGLLAPDGVVALGLSARLLPVDVPGGFTVVSTRRYGDAAMLLLRSQWDEEERG